jgi:AcrR family transcriptional regulator
MRGMAGATKKKGSGTAAPRAARRMSPDRRRAQLEGVALEVVAERGPAELSLDEVAERAGVTRNLLYHYFPRGRADLFLAAVDRSGRDLSDGWVTDPELPHGERLALNFGRVIEHAAGPSDAWRVLRHSRVASDPEVRERSDAYRNLVLEGMALNHFGTADPPPLARLALRAFLAYAEQALDDWREQGLDRDPVLTLLAETLNATAEAARRAGEPAR